VIFRIEGSVSEEIVSLARRLLAEECAHAATVELAAPTLEFSLNPALVAATASAIAAVASLCLSLRRELRDARKRSLPSNDELLLRLESELRRFNDVPIKAIECARGDALVGAGDLPSKIALDVPSERMKQILTISSEGTSVTISVEYRRRSTEPGEPR